MIGVKDAVILLRQHNTSSCYQGKVAVYHQISFQQAQKIADLIEHLSHTCNLEVSELIGDDVK